MRLIASLAVLTFACSPLSAADYWVATTGDDGASGAQTAPWRTLRHAAGQVQPGDTIRVQPGTYAEAIVMQGDQAPDPSVAPIRWLADAGPVTLDGSMRLTSADVEATEVSGVFRWRAPAPLTTSGVNRTPQPLAWVFRNGQRLILHGGKTPLGSSDTFAFSRHNDHVLINLGQDTWPDDATIEVAFRPFGIALRQVANVTVAGFTLRRHAVNAVDLHTTAHCVIEDLHIIQPNLHGISVEASRALTARRLRVFEPNAWGSNFKGQGHLIEENVFQTTGTRNETAGDAWVGVLKFNGGSYHTVRHNVLTDRPPSRFVLAEGREQANAHVFGGIWGDIHCYDNRIYGNSVNRQGHTGIYLEYLTNRSTVMWNTLQDNPVGISTRQSSGNIIRQNWIYDSITQWGRESVDFDNMPGWEGRPIDHPEWARERLDGINLYQTYSTRPSKHNIVLDNLIEVTGRPISIPVPRGMDKATREDVARIMVIDPEQVETDLIFDVDYRSVSESYHTPLNNLIDRNRYSWDPATAFAGFSWFLDSQLDDFAAYQQATGFDAHGQVGDFTPSDIGLQIAWTQPSGTRHPDLPIALDYDGGAERALPVGRAYFARGIWLDLPPEPYSWYRAAGASTATGPGPGGRRAHEPDWRQDARQWTRWPLCRSGVRGLMVDGRDGSVIPPEGLGWRTMSLPVSAGTTMRVQVHLKAQDLVPVDAEAGAVEVVAVFTDWTGHQATRISLLADQPHLRAGSYDWTPVSAVVEVPENATRMIVYIGLKPTQGSLLIDDVELGMILP